MSSADPTVSTNPFDSSLPIFHQPLPTRPYLPSRNSSGPLVIYRDSPAVGLIQGLYVTDDVRSMSPRRTIEDMAKLGKEAREETRRHMAVLQESLDNLLSRIEALSEEHIKLERSNKILKAYIGGLTSKSQMIPIESVNCT